MRPPTNEELRGRIIDQLKFNKPNKMAEELHCKRLAQEAKARGETYVYSPPDIFLILGGPYTLQTVQELVNERYEERRPMLSALRYPCSPTEETLATPDVVTPEAAHLAVFDHATGDWVEGEEVTGVILRSGSVSDWWEFLTARLQNPTGWPDTMEYYLERLRNGVLVAGTNMEAFRARKRFEHDENEILDGSGPEAEAV